MSEDSRVGTLLRASSVRVCLVILKQGDVAVLVN